MNCIICTSGESAGFFSTLMHFTFNIYSFGAVLSVLLLIALFACYRIGIAYTKQARDEADTSWATRGVASRSKTD